MASHSLAVTAIGVVFMDIGSRLAGAYVDRHALEFTQRAHHLQPLIAYEVLRAAAASGDRSP
jgi:hypothetical protein